MRRFRTFAAVAIFGLLVLGCGDGDSPQEQDTDAPAPVVSVQLTPITRQTLHQTIAVDGVTEVLNRENSVAPIDGTVLSLSVEVGNSVKAGDTLATIRTRDSEAAIAGARRLMAQATTQQQKEDARKALQIAQESQQVVPVIAGRPGVVVDRKVSIQQAVTANTDLLQLLDLSTLGFISNVPLHNLAQVHIGQPCRIRFPSLPDTLFDGTVAAISPQSNEGSQTCPVRISFDARSPIIASTLSVGMMGTASIITGVRSDVLVAPTAALLRDDIADAYTIYTVGPDSLAREMAVTVGVIVDSVAEISAPSLHPGESVIVQGNYEVSDSTRVTTGGNQ